MPLICLNPYGSPQASDVSDGLLNARIIHCLSKAKPLLGRKSHKLRGNLSLNASYGFVREFLMLTRGFGTESIGVIAHNTHPLIEALPVHRPSNPVFHPFTGSKVILRTKSICCGAPNSGGLVAWLPRLASNLLFGGRHLLQFASCGKPLFRVKGG